MVGVHSFELTVSGPGFWSWATAHGVMKWGWRMEMESVFSPEYMGPCRPVSSYPPAQAKSNAALSAFSSPCVEAVLDHGLHGPKP